MVGKTNLDQFASGLVGTRSPYGVAPNAFDDRFIPGGSSSGSASAVGAGLVTFALGTDTAGSGRVPAGYNGCVGIKPTLGSVSTVGVVPACASLDCVTVFARTVGDAAEVARLMRAATVGAADVWRRFPAPARVPPADGAVFRFAVPGPEFLDWDGAGECISVQLGQGLMTGPWVAEGGIHACPGSVLCTAARWTTVHRGCDGTNQSCLAHAWVLLLCGPAPGGPEMAGASAKEFTAAAARLQSIGGQLIKVDFKPFADIAAMLYQSSFVAERYSGLHAFLDSGAASKETGGDAKVPGPVVALAQQCALNSDQRLLPVTRAIISGAGEGPGLRRQRPRPGGGKGADGYITSCARQPRSCAVASCCTTPFCAGNRSICRSTAAQHQAC
jgi:allophanate hydrolase